MSIWQEEAARVIDRYSDDVEAAGLGDVWDHLMRMDESGSRSLLLGVIGALGTYLRETGYSPSA